MSSSDAGAMTSRRTRAGPPPFTDSSIDYNYEDESKHAERWHVSDVLNTPDQEESVPARHIYEVVGRDSENTMDGRTAAFSKLMDVVDDVCNRETGGTSERTILSMVFPSYACAV